MASEIKKRDSLHGLLNQACKNKGTNLTHIMEECGRSTSLPTGWKKGFPRLDVAMDIAEYLGISMDELCYGIGNSKTVMITKNQAEWLEIISRIPEERQQLCKDFLKTHAIIPDKYENAAEEGEKIS